MQSKPSDWKVILQYGLIGGGVSILLALVGMVVAFDGRYIIANGITFGQVTLFLPIAEHLNSRKYWIAYTLRSRGRLIIDAGARTLISPRELSL